MKIRNDVWMLVGAYVLYGALAVGPAAVAVAMDWSVYTATPSRCVSLSIAGSIAVALVVLQALGHAPKKVKRVVWYAMAAAVLWALKPIVENLAVLVTCMAVGEGAAMLGAAPLIRRLKAKRDKERMTAVIGAAIEEAQGRV